MSSGMNYGYNTNYNPYGSGYNTGYNTGYNPAAQYMGSFDYGSNLGVFGNLSSLLASTDQYLNISSQYIGTGGMSSSDAYLQQGMQNAYAVAEYRNYLASMGYSQLEINQIVESQTGSSSTVNTAEMGSDDWWSNLYSSQSGSANTNTNSTNTGGLDMNMMMMFMQMLTGDEATA